ncbi:uncharacterized protein LOC110252385 [Exaiptasia diaphana]|uniref:Uncharacterized protein n=1 Tax=Exaiptasia diaphana TaxID=2652724 RepID=A0A913Y6E1_EXADI|nr:uncharacterized protein LOC110252385 [Exaiptasia diaphana]KXJ28981.1 hypothetical protein AC249_AIPGENE1211 [Exaiptasia diaphana]
MKQSNMKNILRKSRTRPTTSSFRPKFGRLHIVRQSRQVLDFDKVGQSTDRPNANRFYRENGFGTSVIVQFIVGIEDISTGELWDCSIKNKQRKLFLENGLFFIDVKISPNGLVCFPGSDFKQNQLPDHLGNVKCVLPVEEDEPLRYNIQIKLYQNNCDVKTCLDCVEFTVHTHEEGHDVYDYQEGRGIAEVERPQLKIKMTGILAEEIGREIIMLFQNLGDNGCYDKFFMEQRKLQEGLAMLEERFGKNHFKDVELSVKLEESILLFEKHQMDDCVRTATEVINEIIAKNITNGPFLMAKAHYIISAVYRQCGNFDMAKQHMEESTEILESVVVCEETAVNQYNWAALLSEKAAKSSLSLVEQKDAEFRFQNCLLHWSAQTQNDSNRCPMRALIRNINFHLRTSRQTYPDERKSVSEYGLIRAYQTIKNVEQNLLKTCSERHKVTFRVAKSDYYIRKAMMYEEDKKQCAEKAITILEDTLKTAIRLKLENEINGINDRMRHLSVLLDRECHEKRYQSQPFGRRRAEENDGRTIIDLLEELCTIQLDMTKN